MGSGGISPTPSPAIRQQLRRQELGGFPQAPAGLEVHRAGVRHEVQAGETPFDIADQYSDAFHMDISPLDLQDANPSLLDDGSQPGALLKVPGVTRILDVAAAGHGNHVRRPQSIRQLDGDFLMTKVGRVQYGPVRTDSVDVQLYRGDASGAERHNSVADAIRAAKAAMRHGRSESPTVAIVRTRSGIATMPLTSQEGPGLGDSGRTRSLAMRATAPEVLGVVEDARGSRNATVRRFDR